MKKCLLLRSICLLIIGFITPVIAQDSQSLESKFGKPEKLYSANDHIWLSPKYDVDGQVCQIILFPKALSERALFLNQEISALEIQDAIESVVPQAMRGKKDDNSGLPVIVNGHTNISFNYEIVKIEFITQKIINDSDAKLKEEELSKTSMGSDERDESIDIDLQIEEKKLSESKKANQGKDRDNQKSNLGGFRGVEFSNRLTSINDIVIITWKNRKCAEK